MVTTAKRQSGIVTSRLTSPAASGLAASGAGTGVPSACRASAAGAQMPARPTAPSVANAFRLLTAGPDDACRSVARSDITGVVLSVRSMGSTLIIHDPEHMPFGLKERLCD